MTQSQNDSDYIIAKKSALNEVKAMVKAEGFTITAIKPLTHETYTKARPAFSLEKHQLADYVVIEFI